MFKVISATGGYGKTTIIHDVSMQIKPGEIIALLGRNGVGKTTLMRFITGLIPAMAGGVEIDGVNAPAAVTKRARMGLGYVPQGRLVFPRMSVTENIAVGAASNGNDVKEAIKEAMDNFPILIPKANDLAGGLSGGQQQILALARALAIKPKILLLDEPTEGVQPSIIDDMAGVLKRVNKEQGISILIAEQNLDFCLSFAERAYVMERGKIVTQIGIDELKENKLLQQELLGV